MPNWTSNRFTTTNPDIIAKLKELEAAGSDDLFDAFVPMPVELKDILTGGRTLDDGTYVKMWREDKDGKAVPITAEERIHLRVQYGADDWYNWSVERWGSKWDASHPSFEFDDDAGTASVAFDSAWSPPEAWFARVVEQHPLGRTTLAYAEGGMGFWGFSTFLNGTVVDGASSDDFWLPDVDWDAIDDSHDALAPSCRAHLEAYGLGTGG